MNTDERIARQVRFGGWLVVALMCAAAWGDTLPSSPRNCLRLGDMGRQDSVEGRAPYIYCYFDGGGYTDIVYYGRSPGHPYPYHELLSGEWGGALYYDGVATGPRAMWLTDRFAYPDWETGSTFRTPDRPEVKTGEWSDELNPTPLVDTARSVIVDGTVRVTIDYEMVDLAEVSGDPNSWVGSPLGVGSAAGQQREYVRSDRYVLLQTYTIQNCREPNAPGTLEDVEFYHLLHSHGADAYGPTVTSVYDDSSIGDPLAQYVPYNPVHQVGNFRYDITQWNKPGTWGGPYYEEHRDWVCMSSTRAPDMFDNGTYRGHQMRPAKGTHVRVEQRALNGVARLEMDEVAGAMGWRLGRLDPNESVSVTLAFMWAHGELERTPLVLALEDSLDGCLEQGGEYTYTVRLDNHVTDPLDPNYLGPIVGAEVKLELPGLVEVVEVGGAGVYDEGEHRAVWAEVDVPVGSIWEGVVAVRAAAELGPGAELVARAESVTDGETIFVEHLVQACCVAGDVVYVDGRVEGASGTSWENAYGSLEEGLARAGRCGSEVWVAAGTYVPEGEGGFSVPAGVEVYGGFAGHEWERGQRDPAWQATVLSGEGLCRNVVVQEGMGYDEASGAVLDGFVVTGATEAGVRLEDCGPTVRLANLVVEGNGSEGIRAERSQAGVRASVVRNNSGDGVGAYGSPGRPGLVRCQIVGNAGRGVYGLNAAPVLLNSLVHGNGAEGVRLVDPNEPGLVRNCTVTANGGRGLVRLRGMAPEVSNCIAWGNGPVTPAGRYGEQWSGLQATYTCVQDPNEPDRVEPDGQWHNITAWPGVVSLDPNEPDCRLEADSPCIDLGHNNVGPAERDLKGEPRLGGVRVDMGADEFLVQSGPGVDWDGDGSVGQYEFAVFARAWLSVEPGFGPAEASANWDGRCDLVRDHRVGIEDLAVLADFWP